MWWQSSTEEALPHVNTSAADVVYSHPDPRLIVPSMRGLLFLNYGVHSLTWYNVSLWKYQGTSFELILLKQTKLIIINDGCLAGLRRPEQNKLFKNYFKWWASHACPKQDSGPIWEYWRNANLSWEFDVSHLLWLWVKARPCYHISLVEPILKE